MQILILILSALAAALAGAALILVMQERRHSREFVSAVDQRFKGMAKANKESKTALLQYVDAAEKRSDASHEKRAKEVSKLHAALRGVNAKAEEAKKAANRNAERISGLEQGMIPDYDAAVKAVDEVNKFNEGLAGILGFDPLAAMKKGRQEDD